MWANRGRWLGRALFIAAALALLGCGGGRTAVIGLGNSGNRIVEDGLLEEVAQLLADDPATPQVTDAMLREIFPGILKRARDGDPEAALVVLLVAEVQREAEES